MHDRATAKLRSLDESNKDILNLFQTTLNSLALIEEKGSLSFRRNPFRTALEGFSIATFQHLPQDISDIRLFDACGRTYHLDNDYLYSFVRVENNQRKISYYKFKNLQQLKTMRWVASHPRIATLEHPVIQPKPASNWENKGIEGIYTKSTVALYNELHKALAIEMDTYLRMHPEIKKIRIIELGCGHGIALYKIAKAAAAILGRENVICIGGDFAPYNIRQAEAFWENKKTEITVELNVIDSTSQECEDLITQKKEGFHDIVISSGHLTRLVLNTVYEGQKVLNKIYRANVKKIFAGGRREELYTKQMLTQMGFDSVINTIPAGSNGVNLIKPATLYPPLEKLLNDNDFKKDIRYFNMSMCPDPVNIIREAKNHPALSKVESLDLSFCELSRYTSDTISTFLKQFPHLKEVIFVSPDPSEINFITKNKFPIKIHTLLTKEERFQALPFDVIQILDSHNVLKALQSDNPDLTEIPTFLYRRSEAPEQKSCLATHTVFQTKNPLLEASLVPSIRAS